MNEIRFSSPSAPAPKPQAEVSKPEPEMKKSSKAFSKIKKVVGLSFVALVLIVVVTFLIPIVKNQLVPKIFGTGDERYVAVFLTNGQVYFGQMQKSSELEIVMKNVYYLQANPTGTGGVSNESLNQSFKLVKLGNELHGPTDELYINRSQMVFFEYLRPDSSVVESITKQ